MRTCTVSCSGDPVGLGLGFGLFASISEIAITTADPCIIHRISVKPRTRTGREVTRFDWPLAPQSQRYVPVPSSAKNAKRLLSGDQLGIQALYPGGVTSVSLPDEVSAITTRQPSNSVVLWDGSRRCRRPSKVNATHLPSEVMAGH